jgi:predicted RNA-binding Zn-ribbon protein involved in translation (DUF1610 family)
MSRKKPLAKHEFLMCRRKRVYTARAAHRVVGFLNGKGSTAHVYRCPACGNFHVGRLNLKFKRKEKEEIYDSTNNRNNQ